LNSRLINLIGIECGKTLLEIAEENGRSDVVEYLEDVFAMRNLLKNVIYTSI
jgi:hypothetical protein